MIHVDLESLRQTGRTTRMLKAAIAEVMTNRSHVIVICDSQASCIRMCQETVSLSNSAMLVRVFVRKIYYVGPVQSSNTIEFMTPKEANLDWETLEVGFGLLGEEKPKKVVVYIDHYTIELHLFRAIKELHRFDL